ncbi:MAG: 30S ribosomal protein S1 [Clostridia bacterium]|nr:30S ribosomal protein S1 [Clostridia bacterium]
MTLTLAKSSGFCPGVKRADSVLNKAVAENPDAKIYTLGSLIHNRLYNEALASRGIRAVELSLLSSILEESDTPVILLGRTHGITLEEETELHSLAHKYKHLTFIDLTCAFVKKVHDIAERETDEDTVFLLFADKGHPEALGTLSRAKGECHIFSSFDELKNINIGEKRVIFAAQTTQNLEEFKKIKIFSKKLYTNAIFFDTICNVTEKRQREATELASSNEAVIVIGGKSSANTRKLYELCRAVCEKTYLVESAEELRSYFPIYADSIAITAGASTPDGIILEVIKAMEKENDFKSMLEDSLKTLHTGETVTGTVVTIGKNEIKLDLGTKFTGVLEKEQITDDPAANLGDMFKVGDQVDVFVIRVEDGKGIATLSKKRVDADNSWVVLKAAYDNGDILEGKVTSVVKGGVIVSTSGNTVFVPASQTGVPKGEDLKVLVGTTQKIKLLEFDETKKKALGSIKAILVAEKKAQEEAIWATLEVGAHYMGVVKNLTSYGAFVDIGGVDGMVHNSELSYKRIKHPSQVVSVGQEIDVYIKELDVEKKRISLGYKTQEMDTWFQFTQKFSVGDVVSAKIVSIMPFGAFAEVYEDVDGLIHISRISTERIASPADVLSVGQVVDVKIIEIDDEKRRLALSIRALKEEEEKAAKAAAEAEAKAAADAEAAAEAERIAQEKADMAPYIVGSID